MNDKGEDCTVWLARVAKESPNPYARACAADDIDSYHAFMNHARTMRKKTRRDLWDLVCGELGHTPGNDFCVTRTAGRPFKFHVYVEPCDRRGIAIPQGAILTHVPVDGHRVPQVEKWGERLRT